MDMTPIAARTLSTLLEERTGQELVPGRRWRLDAGLKQVMRRHDITNADVLAARAVMPGQRALAEDVVEALLNHETSFYRDLPLFTTLTGEALPSLAAERGDLRRLRIWCAGCSTGQEPYSLALTLAGNPAWRDWRIEIVGTDVSPAAIAQAREGRYSQFEVQRGLPIRQLVMHFEEDGEERWRVGAELRGRVTFQVHNLLEPMPGRPFDLVLCRNVLLYFTPERRAEVFAHLADAVVPNGVLMLGAGETVLGQTDAFAPDPALKGFYRRAA
jgi:chemotaxis protein methyltransferase CheR